jgi:putative chitinase
MPVGDVQKNLMDQLKTQGINDPTAIANIMAQVQAESGFNPQSENLKYSGKKLFELYGAGNKGGNKARFNTLEEADALAAKGPEAVGNVIYGGRMGNKEDEGFKYRGRGLIQLTGKDNYKKFGDLIGVDLVGNPDMANDPTVANKIAAAYFAEKQKKGVNLSDINAIGKAVGYAGGAAETAKRAQLASGFTQQLGGATPTTSSVVASTQQPAAVQATPALATSAVAPPPTKTASLNDVLKELAMLNNNVGQLIAINSSAVNTAKKQLSVQQSMTNDVFSA